MYRDTYTLELKHHQWRYLPDVEEAKFAVLDSKENDFENEAMATSLVFFSSFLMNW